MSPSADSCAQQWTPAYLTKHAVHLHNLLTALDVPIALSTLCAGVVVFQQESQHGNGTVAVTAHAASCPLWERDGRGMQEWRTMRFNEVTRQSVGRVRVPQRADGAAALEMQPECLAMEYLKTMASAGKAVIWSAPGMRGCIVQAVDVLSRSSACPQPCS